MELKLNNFNLFITKYKIEGGKEPKSISSINKEAYIGMQCMYVRNGILEERLQSGGLRSAKDLKQSGECRGMLLRVLDQLQKLHAVGF
jgi:hypothetical protein